jgi:hypothetical protein
VFDVFIMDMGGHDENVRNLQTQYPHAKVVRYYNNHLDTLKRCITRCRTPYAWVISSCCSYDNFDFSYKALPWEAYQLHCWASGTQEFGDTFLINVVEFNKQKNVDMLEWYKDINWHTNGVERLLWPLLECASENVTAELTAYEFNTPYVWVNARTTFDAPLWKDRAFYSFNASNSLSLAPRDITGHLVTQIYDYPYILKENLVEMAPNLLDIIYISNGEPDAEKWYQHLVDTVYRNPANALIRIRRILNVNGRTKAYQAAAAISRTPWFFAVFAKLEVVDEFAWNWQPDYFQEPKHYIFHSMNPVNRLEYGHMGVIAYNKQLVADTHDTGLDFTLSRAHAVVPIVSAIAHYNTTPELTWRTAFRECIKLRNDVSTTSNIESDYRLDVWLGRASASIGAHANWSIKGAEDAIAYFDEVGGNYEKLMLTFEWAWLKEFYATKYTL